MKKYEFSVKLQHSFFFYKIILTRKCVKLKSMNFHVKLKRFEFSRQIAMFCFDFRIDDFTRIFISTYVIILGT